MCLNLGLFSKKHIAKEDITVYKLVRQDVETSEIFTPFQWSYIKLGVEYESELIRKGFSVEDGLHSFVKLRGCKRFAAKYFIPNLLHSHRKLIIECKIPKGSTYYKGYFCNRRSIASDKLIYERIC